MSRPGSRRFAVASLVLAACLLSAPSVFAQNTRSGGDSLASALQRGDYEAARREALRHDDPASMLARARLAKMKGKDADARRFAEVSLSKATTSADRVAAIRFLALMEREEGKWSAAEQRLRKGLKADGKAHALRFELGRLLWDQGEQAKAKVLLRHFNTLYNNGRLTKASELVLLARAKVLLGNFDDANFAFKESIRADAKRVEAYVFWSEMLLGKFKILDARNFLDQALKLNPNHVQALATRAAVEMSASNRTDRTRSFLDRAERVSPGAPDVLVQRAILSIRDEDCDTALTLAARVLKKAPKRLDAHTIKATCLYLKDDTAGFESAKKAALKINPKYADLLTFTGDYAVRAHRYVQAMSLYREALKIQPDHPGALVGLGIGLSRIGKEDEARQYLQKGHDVDGYNARAFNMLEMYDKVMPSYSFTEFKGFKVRAHSSQRELVNHLVAPVVAESIKVFNKKYGIKPDAYLAVEIYPDSTTFSVRSVGMPNISPHGICFGRVVTVRSPSDGNFNWRQVVWHEMAHVYHLKLSKSRVPRWFTEGLAEYETNIYDPSWSRYHDQEIAVKLFKDDIPSVVHLSRGFTHARTHGEILRSYHLASLAIHFIAETYKFDAIPAMLRAFATNKNTAQAIQHVLKITPAEFDAKFKVWLRRKYMHFQQQLLPDVESFGTLKELQNKTAMSGNNPRTWTKLAIVQHRRRMHADATRSIERALKLAPKDAFVSHGAMYIAARSGRMKDAIKYGEQVLDAGEESYDLRMYMGVAALRTEDVKGSRVHFEAATQLYPDGKDAWTMLQRIATRTKDAKLKERTARRLYELNQHSPATARQQYEDAMKKKDWKRAHAAARRWIDINPFDPQSQRAFAAASIKVKRPVDAVYGLDALVILRSGERAEALLDATRTLARAGYTKQAQRYAKQAREAKVDEARVKAALAGE